MCSNLTTFKSILRTSRQLDDAIPLRLNRQSALAASSSLSPAGCDRFWNELRSSWTARAKLIGYCENEMRPKADSRHAVKGEVEERLSVGREQKEEEQRRRGRGATEQEVEVSKHKSSYQTSLTSFTADVEL